MPSHLYPTQNQTAGLVFPSTSSCSLRFGRKWSAIYGRRSGYSRISVFAGSKPQPHKDLLLVGGRFGFFEFGRALAFVPTFALSPGLVSVDDASVVTQIREGRLFF